MADCKKIEIPITEKVYLTLDEASAIFGIGVNKLRKVCDEHDKHLVLWVGQKRLIKKQRLKDFLDEQESV